MAEPNEDVFAGLPPSALQQLASFLAQPFANNTRFSVPSEASSPISWYQPPAATPATRPSSARNFFSGAAPTTPPAQHPTEAAPSYDNSLPQMNFAIKPGSSVAGLAQQHQKFIQAPSSGGSQYTQGAVPTNALDFYLTGNTLQLRPPTGGQARAEVTFENGLSPEVAERIAEGWDAYKQGRASTMRGGTGPGSWVTGGLPFNYQGNPAGGTQFAQNAITGAAIPGYGQGRMGGAPSGDLGRFRAPSVPVPDMDKIAQWKRERDIAMNSITNDPARAWGGGKQALANIAGAQQGFEQQVNAYLQGFGQPYANAYQAMDMRPEYMRYLPAMGQVQNQAFANTVAQRRGASQDNLEAAHAKLYNTMAAMQAQGFDPRMLTGIASMMNANTKRDQQQADQALLGMQ